MHTNLLTALYNIINSSKPDLNESYNGNNRVNNVGVSLENFVKDSFCNTINTHDEAIRMKAYSDFFSYIGNQNNPPDFMIKAGDAVEVKKIENIKSEIALNSSHPKDRLYSDSHMITKSCRESENWTVKDLVYAIGFTNSGSLKVLNFIYGDCYSADKDVYERIKNSISEGILSLDGIIFSPTKELGRVNKVDPLGITNLRIRGMWHIQNPISVFDYIYKPEISDGMQVNAIMQEKKYKSFPEEDRKNLEKGLEKIGGILKMVNIKSPNNPAILLNSIYISFKV